MLSKVKSLYDDMVILVLAVKRLRSTGNYLRCMVMCCAKERCALKNQAVCSVRWSQCGALQG